MARPGWPERNKAARSFRQLRRFLHVINSDRVFGTHTGDYITELPKAEQDLEEWQAAVEALPLVVNLNGPAMMARIGVMRALNRDVERTFDSPRKDTHWGRQRRRPWR